MKKVVLVLATALTLLSCKKEVVYITSEKKTDTVSDTTKKEDCGCDRVFKIENNGDHYSFQLNSYLVYTVNDCSKFNQIFVHQIYNTDENPILGECYKPQE